MKNTIYLLRKMVALKLGSNLPDMKFWNDFVTSGDFIYNDTAMRIGGFNQFSSEFTGLINQLLAEVDWLNESKFATAFPAIYNLMVATDSNVSKTNRTLTNVSGLEKTLSNLIESIQEADPLSALAARLVAIGEMAADGATNHMAIKTITQPHYIEMQVVIAWLCHFWEQAVFMWLLQTSILSRDLPKDLLLHAVDELLFYDQLKGWNKVPEWIYSSFHALGWLNLENQGPMLNRWQIAGVIVSK